MKDISSAGLPAGKIPQIRVLATLAVSNKGGNIFGGWIMSQVDVAGSIPAGMRARGRIVTRAVSSFEFKKPVFIGDLLSCYAEIVSEGRTSISVYVEIYVQRMHDGVMECIKVTEATVVYVAIDSEGRPRALPPEP